MYLGHDGRCDAPHGAQTLARGLAALQIVADSSGLTTQEVADRLGIHRTNAHRILLTLSAFHYIARGPDQRYRSAPTLSALADSYDGGIRSRCLPLLQQLAAEQRTAVSLLVSEGAEAVSVAVVLAPGVAQEMSFREGSRHPLTRGAAGVALRAAMPVHPDEPVLVRQARRIGWAMTFGQVEPDTYGLAVPVRRAADASPTCLTVITRGRRPDHSVVAAAQATAERLASTLA